MPLKDKLRLNRLSAFIHK